MKNSCWIRGVDNIGTALADGIGRKMVLKLIHDHGLPAFQLEDNGPWIVSSEKLQEWARKFRTVPRRVNR